MLDNSHCLQSVELQEGLDVCEYDVFLANQASWQFIKIIHRRHVLLVCVCMWVCVYMGVWVFIWGGNNFKQE